MGVVGSCWNGGCSQEEGTLCECGGAWKSPFMREKGKQPKGGDENPQLWILWGVSVQGTLLPAPWYTSVPQTSLHLDCGVLASAKGWYLALPQPGA